MRHALHALLLLLAVVAGILVVGAPGPWPFGHGAGQTDLDIGPGDRFTPASATVHQGDVVTWHFDGNDHTVTSQGGPGQAWDSGVMGTGTYSHTFDRAGTFPYLCVLHSKMLGTILVLAADAPPPAATTPATAPPTSTGAPAAGTPATGPTSTTPAGPLGAAPPRIAALRLKLSRHCRAGRCSAVASLTASGPGSLTVRAGPRRLVAATVAAGAQRVHVPLARLHRGHTRLSFTLADRAGNRSAVVKRTVSVR